MKLWCPQCKLFVDPSPGMLPVFAFCSECSHPLGKPPDCLLVDEERQDIEAEVREIDEETS